MKKIGRENFWELFRYGVGCGCNVLLKILFTAIFAFLSAPVWVAYLGAQILILFPAYFYHTYFTFHSHPPRGFYALAKNFGTYTASVAVFKAIDYVSVIVIEKHVTTYLEQQEVLGEWTRQAILSSTIFAVSFVLFFSRYFIYRFLFKQKSATKGNPLE